MEKYLTYIYNAQNPTVEEFIEDWEPIGERVIEDLKMEGLAFEKEGRLYITEKIIQTPF